MMPISLLIYVADIIITTSFSTLAQNLINKLNSVLKRTSSGFIFNLKLNIIWDLLHLAETASAKGHLNSFACKSEAVPLWLLYYLDVRCTKMSIAGCIASNHKTLDGIRRLRSVYDPCTEKHSTKYFNLPEVQTTLHVDPDHKPAKWQTCSDVVANNWKDSPRSVLNIYGQLIPTGLRIWIFSGNTDAVIPVTSTRYTINALNLSTLSPWRAWYDDGEVGGWTQEYAGLTFVNVRGPGHEVPLHRPKLALTLFKAFLAGTSMPTLEPLTLIAAS